MKMMKILPFLILSLFLAEAYALTAEEKGLEIAKEADRRDTGWGDYTATMTMVLYNRHGEKSERFMRTKSLEGTADGDKTTLVFDKPKDVKGTALLTFTHKTGPDDQWLFLPALKRVKRIASRNKSGPFVGSEFAYEDLTSQEVEKYTYKFLRDEPYGGMDCYVVERDPVDEFSGYTFQHVWGDKEEYRPHKIDFYDRKGTLLKTLTFEGYKQYLGQYWRADKLLMVNHQSGKKTELLWRDYKFGNGLKDSDFTKNSLKRLR
ncbi:MAG: outer membrane lipoprotein-sorting protein [Gammaproteobacteria bacterium]|nr:MAG: outer membrane lipoprotein-sorting protein [Gammaproteobacteria bacterium]